MTIMRNLFVESGEQLDGDDGVVEARDHGPRAVAAPQEPFLRGAAREKL